MASPSFVLVPSPLVGAETFEPLRDSLERAGFETRIVSGAVPAAAPYWKQLAGSISRQIAPGSETVLIGHSGAGPALALVAEANAGVRAIIYLDATLLEPGQRWLDTFDAETLAQPTFRESMARGVMPNPWMGPELWRHIGVRDEAQVAQLAASSRELPVAWYEEPVPIHVGAGAAAAYVAFVPNPFYVPMAESARANGWPAVELPGMHFHFLVEPELVGERLISLAAALLSGVRT